MAREYRRWLHSAALTNGQGRLTDIVPSPQSYWFVARPMYTASGDDPVLGPWGLHRYDDWAELADVSSDTPSISTSPDGDNWLLNYAYPEEATADFGGFYLFKRNGRLGIASRATSLSPEIQGVEVIEFPFS